MKREPLGTQRDDAPIPYEAPDVEPMGSVRDITSGAAPGVPIDSTFINARPAFSTS